MLYDLHKSKIDNQIWKITPGKKKSEILLKGSKMSRFRAHVLAFSMKDEVKQTKETLKTMQESCETIQD